MRPVTETDRIAAAISYVGRSADELLLLGVGDSVVFDGSDEALRGGLSSPAALRRWHDAGVQLYSLAGLHAKILLVEDTTGRVRPHLLVGSMNLSRHSNEAL